MATMSNSLQEDYVPRPRNKWIIFRQKFAEEYNESTPLSPTQSPKERNAEISQAASKAWRLLPDEERQKYERMQEAEAAEHRQKYPDYIYQPGYKKQLQHERAALKKQQAAAIAQAVAAHRRSAAEIKARKRASSNRGHPSTSAIGAGVASVAPNLPSPPASGISTPIVPSMSPPCIQAYNYPPSSDSRPVLLPTPPVTPQIIHREATFYAQHSGPVVQAHINENAGAPHPGYRHQVAARVQDREEHMMRAYTKVHFPPQDIGLSAMSGRLYSYNNYNNVDTYPPNAMGSNAGFMTNGLGHWQRMQSLPAVGYAHGFNGGLASWAQATASASSVAHPEQWNSLSQANFMQPDQFAGSFTQPAPINAAQVDAGAYAVNFQDEQDCGASQTSGPIGFLDPYNVEAYKCD